MAKNYVKEIREKVGHMPLQLPGTGIVVIRKNDNEEIEVLLQRRRDLDKFGLLGGGIELGESYEMCAVRELREESGLEVEETKLKLFPKIYAGENHKTTYPNGDVVYHTVVVYIVNYNDCGGSLIQHNSETKALTWFPVNELKDITNEQIFPNNLPIIRDIQNYKF